MNNKNNNKGFTLIELIIAMSILSIVLVIGYNIINKSGSFINLQQYITQNQSVANLVNTYISKDIEESKSISEKETIDDNTYKYTITKVNNSVEYKIELVNKNGKKVYNLTRNDGDSNIEIISNQIRNNDEPFLIGLKNNGIYEVKISYSENGKLKEYSFDVSSRLSTNTSGSGSSDEVGSENGNEDDDNLKPSIEDIPELPEGVGPNTHYIGFWVADSEKQKKNNIYTWIDSNFEKGSSNKQKNDISAKIVPGNNYENERSRIEDTQVEGAITAESKVEFLSIYVSKGTTVEDFEIKSNQSGSSINVINDSTRDSTNGKVNLNGGANDGKWYTCEVSGNINSFEITSGKLSINNSITDSGFILIVYSEKSQDYGDADIIIEYNRESGNKENEFILRNKVKVKKDTNTYETVRESRDTYDSSIQTVLLNFTHEGDPNIFVQIEKVNEVRIKDIYGFNLYDKNNIIKEAILTLEGDIYISDTSKLSEIEHKKKYRMKFASQNDEFRNRVIVSGLKEGETGLLKINLIK